VRSPLLSCAALAALLLLPACVERKFLIQSEPPGAAVLVNGAYAGTTPTEIVFQNYGVVRLEVLPLDLDGDGWIDYRNSVQRHELASPWYQWFPIDFFTDNLWPWTLEDRHSARLVLEPALEPDVPSDWEEMRERAKALRVRAEKVRLEGEVESEGPEK
jgi:hypothetical protein